MNDFISKLYVCLTAAVLILSAITLSKSDYILFQDAEWKVELYLLASMWSAVMFLPTAIVTFLFRKAHRERISKWNLHVRRLIFAPMVMSGGAFAFWPVLWFLGVVRIDL